MNREVIEQKIYSFKDLSCQIDELEERRKALGVEILAAMEGKTLEVPGAVAKKCERLSIKTSIEDARPLGVTKMEEVLDREKIKKLHKEGATIPGVFVFQYVQVTKKVDENF